MRRLTIKDFSCIKDATIEFNRMTVLIGPQASGKSVICKLAYFFMDVVRLQSQVIANGGSIDVFRENISTKFREWFPYSAWGNGKFKIEFTAGDYQITLTRISYSKKVNDKFRVRLSDQFVEHYEVIRAFANRELGKSKEKTYGYDSEWRVKDYVDKVGQKLLGKDFLEFQLFVPAGRSFFTSMGKAVAAFEQGRVLDPLIIQFGRIFTAYKERRFRFMTGSSVESRRSLEDALAKILGGKLVLTGDQEYVECTDGRRVPLSALSSGQQELLPLISVVPLLSVRGRRQCIYIEEPEAHLFPSSQSALVEAFAGMINNSNGIDLVLTTHSPYVLVKINNLIKAGQLGRSHSESKRASVAKVVSRSSWLGARSVHAYAICNGVVESIVDEDGLVNAEYLDAVSGEIGNEFMRLLEIEVSD